MSGSIEGNTVGNPSENTEEEIPEVRVLTEEVVNEQIKGIIVTRQLEGLTRLVQGMLTTLHPSQYPKANYSAFSGASVHQSERQTSIWVVLQAGTSKTKAFKISKPRVLLVRR